MDPRLSLNPPDPPAATAANGHKWRWGIYEKVIAGALLTFLVWLVPTLFAGARAVYVVVPEHETILNGPEGKPAEGLVEQVKALNKRPEQAMDPLLESDLREFLKAQKLKRGRAGS